MRTVMHLLCALLPVCGFAKLPAHAAEAPVRTFELTITANAVPADQRVLRAVRGERVTMRIASDTAGELHIHGYRQEARLAAGGATELAFVARATGRYRIEWHAAGRGGGDHHGPGLATLEVRPQ